MPAVTTEGLILKRSNFGEADRVLTVDIFLHKLLKFVIIYAYETENCLTTY
jgi:hypothetical protein